MNEPLFDGLTAVSAFLAISAVLTLRPADPPPINLDRIKQRQVIGLVLLVLSIGALLYRWIDSVTAFPAELRLSLVRQALLTAVCGFGIAAAILSVTATTVAARVKSFLAVAACGVIALVLAAAWEWALLWIALLAFGVWAVVRISRRAAIADDAVSDNDPRRELGLIMFAAASVLVVLLGTWQHVVKNESQRQTRSTRYSAWPRATALANAWERSGWVVKADENDSKKLDLASAELVSVLAAREQRIACGLGAMLLVVAGVAWRQSSQSHSKEPMNDVSEAVCHGS